MLFEGWTFNPYKVSRLRQKEVGSSRVVVFLPVNPVFGRAGIPGYWLVVAVKSERNGRTFCISRDLVNFYAGTGIPVANLSQHNGLRDLGKEIFALPVGSPDHQVVVGSRGAKTIKGQHIVVGSSRIGLLAGNVPYPGCVVAEGNCFGSP